MASIVDYHRPRSVDEALALLNRPGKRSALLGGGTTLVASRGGEPIEVIDLQALPMAGIERFGDARVGIGAMSRLQQIVDSELVPPLVRDAARREAPNTIRNAATVGGTIANADGESGLLAALLVHDADVRLVSESGSEEISLVELLGDSSRMSGRIIASISVAVGGDTGRAATSRTPADTPIVCAFARRHDGRITLALTGVASTPILLERHEIGDLDPPADFRGSTEYRRALAETLADRALASLDAGS